MSTLPKFLQPEILPYASVEIIREDDDQARIGQQSQRPVEDHAATVPLLETFSECNDRIKHEMAAAHEDETPSPMHTPGPWTAVLTTEPMIQEDATGCRLAHVWCIGDESEKHANAHLIAAAPELLDALKDAVAALGGIRSDNVPESVRLAIAKAEGRS